MDVVSVKFQEDILKKMDKSIELHNFNSRTEFIREAVRDKLADLSRDELVVEFMKFSGKSKIKTTDEENERTREIASKELLADLKKQFNLK
jgi:metal-responsive CopG/Arc/MetJ family transcriptional regulator